MREDLDGISCSHLCISEDQDYKKLVSLFGDEYTRTLRKAAKVAVDLRVIGRLREANFVEELFIRFWKLRELMEERAGEE